MPNTAYAVSEGQKFNADTTLVVVTCYSCQMPYAIPESLDRSARKYPGNQPRGWQLTCPLGHVWYYTGRSIEQQRDDARNALAAERARHDQTRASLRGTKGVVTKQRKKLARVVNGVCPCCNRHFTNLERHMHSKHPGFKPEAVEADGETVG